MSNDLAQRINNLYSDIFQTYQDLSIEEKSKQLGLLESQSRKPDFWQDNERAKRTMKEIAKLKDSTEPWSELLRQVTEAKDLAAMGDTTLEVELADQYRSMQVTYDTQKKDLLFSGPYDENDAILSIHAGAGGTDAQDWAMMLERMYIRWAEAKNMKATIVERSPGEEAGIKSVTIELSGKNAYGKLKSEHGVHRLVRLSPFNSDNLRQTSFAKVEILPEISEPDDIAIDDKDIKIDVFRAGGHGGQSVNTTDSAVRITHLPTGIVVSIQNERSQLQNKQTALTILRSKLAALQLEQHKDKISELKGPNQSAEWGNQVRNYVLHPYKQVKDVRTSYETSDADAVLNGKLDEFIHSYLEHTIGD